MDRTTSVAKVQTVLLPDGERTWTVVDGEPLGGRVGGGVSRVHALHRPIAEHGQVVCAGAGVVVAVPRRVYGLAWDAVTVEDFGAFLTGLRSGDTPAVASIAARRARFSEETIAVRLQAVMSLYRYHHFNGVETASRLYERRPARRRRVQAVAGAHRAQAPERERRWCRSARRGRRSRRR